MFTPDFPHIAELSPSSLTNMRVTTNRSHAMLTRLQNRLRLAHDTATLNDTVPFALQRGVTLSNAAPFTIKKTGTNAKAYILRLPFEVLLQIASYLYGDPNQIYLFEQARDKSSWTLRIRDVPSPLTSNNRPKRYGCRVIFPIRLRVKDSYHPDRNAFYQSHPYFASVLKLQHPPKLPPKPTSPKPLAVYDHRVGESTDDKPLPGQYWLKEKTTDDVSLDGWGMVWTGRWENDNCWPKGLPRLGYPESTYAC